MQYLCILLTLVVLCTFVDGQNEKFEYECEILQRIERVEERITVAEMQRAATATKLEAAEQQLKEQQNLITNLTTHISEIKVTRCPVPWLEFKGSCYLFGNGTLFTFLEAEEFCRQHLGHLVHIEDADENTFLKNYARTYRRI